MIFFNCLSLLDIIRYICHTRILQSTTIHTTPPIIKIGIITPKLVFSPLIYEYLVISVIVFLMSYSYSLQ